MTDIDLDAIRKRDADWRHDGHFSVRNAASQDRRDLLLYIDSLELLVDDISRDLRSVKALCQPKPEEASQVTSHETP